MVSVKREIWSWKAGTPFPRDVLKVEPPTFPHPKALASSRPQSYVVRREPLPLRSCPAQEAGSIVWLGAMGTVSGGGGVGWGTVRCPAGVTTLINLQYVMFWTKAGFPARQAWFTSCCVALGK